MKDPPRGIKISQNYTTISAQNMTTLFIQNQLKARYKSTCLSKEVTIKETLFSEYPHVWWLRVGSQGKKGVITRVLYKIHPYEQVQICVEAFSIWFWQFCVFSCCCVNNFFNIENMSNRCIKVCFRKLMISQFPQNSKRWNIFQALKQYNSGAYF